MVASITPNKCYHGVLVEVALKRVSEHDCRFLLVDDALFDYAEYETDLRKRIECARRWLNLCR